MQILEALWIQENLLSRDILENVNSSKIAYSTLSMSLRLLENKGFISHRKVNNAFHYYAILKKEDYLVSLIKGILDGHFSSNQDELINYIH
ncbi:BlaI/MecI/CopY family transcriptional regulator [Pedobacter sp. BMA]|uniref:BlaI/MecI/CopY family transcriptional regulator n=1 Tax=Pedobacter sp. BMA TaxID=1663685 RepID=UPI0018CD9ECE